MPKNHNHLPGQYATVTDATHPVERSIKLQAQAERSYQIDPHVRDANASLSIEEVRHQLETEHVVKHIPRFRDVARDESRTNLLQGVSGSDKALSSRGTRSPEHTDQLVTVTEHEALQEVQSLFDALIERGAARDTRYAEMATDMRDHMAFVGEKELNEATVGIAEYWKGYLADNPKAQIYVALGEVLRSLAYTDTDRHETPRMKSDEYLFGRIMDHWSPEDIADYRGRIVIDDAEITAENPQDVKVVFLDDWTISGEQIDKSTTNLRGRLPDYASSVEVQLVAADKSLLSYGYSRKRIDGPLYAPVPVRAYYMVDDPDFDSPDFRASITGSHSSVDFGFAQEIETCLKEVQAEARETGEQLPPILQTMPIASNILRTYALTDSALDMRHIHGVQSEALDW